MKISDFFKTHFFSIIFTFINDFTLNSDNNKEIWSSGPCWPLLAFVGLHWPLWPWKKFLSKNWPLLIKIKHNLPVSNNQMSKLISEGDQAFQFTVLSISTWKASITNHLYRLLDGKFSVIAFQKTFFCVCSHESFEHLACFVATWIVMQKV